MSLHSLSSSYSSSAPVHNLSESQVPTPSKRKNERAMVSSKRTSISPFSREIARASLTSEVNEFELFVRFSLKLLFPSKSLSTCSRPHNFVHLALHHLEILNQHSSELRDKSDIASCKGGIWYWDDYFSALAKSRSVGKARLNALVESCGFYNGYAPSTCFRPVKDLRFPTELAPYTFQIKRDVLPSKALDALIKGPSILDCGSFLQLSVFLALKDLLGEERFNVLFAPDSDPPLRIDPEWSNMIGCLFFIIPIMRSSEVQKGDICTFTNIPLYVQKHPTGIAQAYNVCCNQDRGIRTFSGFGIPSGSTQDEIEQILFNSFNSDPVTPEDFGTESGILEKLKLEMPSPDLKNQKIDWDTFNTTPVSFGDTRAEGKLLLRVIRPHQERIAELIATPKDKIREVSLNLFGTYHLCS